MTDVLINDKYGDDSGLPLKIRRLPGARTSPDTVLHQTIEKLPRIKAVAMVIVWDDGSFDTDWSVMKATELCTAARLLGIRADQALLGDYMVSPAPGDGKEGA